MAFKTRCCLRPTLFTYTQSKSVQFWLDFLASTPLRPSMAICSVRIRWTRHHSGRLKLYSIQSSEFCCGWRSNPSCRRGSSNTHSSSAESPFHMSPGIFSESVEIRGEWGIKITAQPLPLPRLWSRAPFDGWRNRDLVHAQVLSPSLCAPDQIRLSKLWLLKTQNICAAGEPRFKLERVHFVILDQWIIIVLEFASSGACSAPFFCHVLSVCATCFGNCSRMEMDDGRRTQCIICHARRRSDIHRAAAILHARRVALTGCEVSTNLSLRQLKSETQLS